MFTSIHPTNMPKTLEDLEPGEILFSRCPLTKGVRVTVVCGDCGIVVSSTVSPADFDRVVEAYYGSSEGHR